MPWQKGQTGNPGGRPKDEARQLLEQAIKRVEKTRKVKFFDHVVRQAYRNPAVLVAVLRKIVPDLKSIEGKLDAGDTLHDLLAWLAGRANGNGAKHDASGD